MAVTQNPIIGRSKQSLSNTVFSTWKGRNVIRAKPLEVANPRTLGQVSSRNKIKILSGMAKNLRAAIVIGLKSVSQLVTEYNSFVQANYDLVTTSPTTGEVTDVGTPIIVSANDDNGVLPTLLAVEADGAFGNYLYTFSRAFTAAEVARYKVIVCWRQDEPAANQLECGTAEVTLTASATFSVPNLPLSIYSSWVLFYNPATYKSQQSVVFEF